MALVWHASKCAGEGVRARMWYAHPVSKLNPISASRVARLVRDAPS